MSEHEDLMTELNQVRMEMLDARGKRFDRLRERYNEIVDKLMGQA